MFEITLKFLEAVKSNNSTEWLHAHWDLYQQEKKRFEHFISLFLEKVKKLNPSRADLQIKDCIFRFNKDLRFSKDGKPYKENFWAIFAFWGKKSDFPCFYFHLQPGASFWGGGAYLPTKTTEEKIRLHLLEHFHKRKKLTQSSVFRDYYGEVYAPHHYKSLLKIKQVIHTNPEILSKISPELKKYNLGQYAQIPASTTLPKASEKTLGQIFYFKDRIFEHRLRDEDLCSISLEEKMIEGFQILQPVLNFLESVY